MKIERNSRNRIKRKINRAKTREEHDEMQFPEFRSWEFIWLNFTASDSRKEAPFNRMERDAAACDSYTANKKHERLAKFREELQRGLPRNY